MEYRKTKTKEISLDINSPRNQSNSMKEISVAAPKRGKLCATRVAIGFGFTSDWMKIKSGASIINQSRSVLQRNQKQTRAIR